MNVWTKFHGISSDSCSFNQLLRHRLCHILPLCPFLQPHSHLPKPIHFHSPYLSTGCPLTFFPVPVTSLPHPAFPSCPVVTLFPPVPVTWSSLPACSPFSTFPHQPCSPAYTSPFSPVSCIVAMWFVLLLSSLPVPEPACLPAFLHAPVCKPIYTVYHYCDNKSLNCISLPALSAFGSYPRCPAYTSHDRFTITTFVILSEMMLVIMVLEEKTGYHQSHYHMFCQIFLHTQFYTQYVHIVVMDMVVYGISAALTIFLKLLSTSWHPIIVWWTPLHYNVWFISFWLFLQCGETAQQECWVLQNVWWRQRHSHWCSVSPCRLPGICQSFVVLLVIFFSMHRLNPMRDIKMNQNCGREFIVCAVVQFDQSRLQIK